MGSKTCNQNLLFKKNLLPYMAYSQNMAKLFIWWSWRRLHNWKSKKLKKIIDVIIIITIYNPFFFLNENF